MISVIWSVSALTWIDALSPILRVRIHLAAISRVSWTPGKNQQPTNQSPPCSPRSRGCDQLVRIVCVDARAEVVWTDEDERGLHEQKVQKP